MKSICGNHEKEVFDIVACNDCNTLHGYVAVSPTLGVFYMENKPNIWPDEKSAFDFLKKNSLMKLYKPIGVVLIFE